MTTFGKSVSLFLGREIKVEFVKVDCLILLGLRSIEWFSRGGCYDMLVIPKAIMSGLSGHVYNCEHQTHSIRRYRGILIGIPIQRYTDIPMGIL